MKVLNIALFMVMLMAVGCKTQKIASKPEPVKSETVAKSGDLSVRSTEERVSAVNGEAKDFGTKSFYIILGSFEVIENAQKFKKQLMAENFFPGILFAPDAKDGKGMYRVCANSYDDESVARSKVAEIRQKFPKYSDLWLLIKKQ